MDILYIVVFNDNKNPKICFVTNNFQRAMDFTLKEYNKNQSLRNFYKIEVWQNNGKKICKYGNNENHKIRSFEKCRYEEIKEDFYDTLREGFYKILYRDIW